MLIMLVLVSKIMNMRDTLCTLYHEAWDPFWLQWEFLAFQLMTTMSEFPLFVDATLDEILVDARKHHIGKYGYTLSLKDFSLTALQACFTSSFMHTALMSEAVWPTQR